MNDYARGGIVPASGSYGLWQPWTCWVGERGPEYVAPARAAAQYMWTYARRRFPGEAWRYLRPDADGLVARPTLER